MNRVEAYNNFNYNYCVVFGNLFLSSLGEPTTATIIVLRGDDGLTEIVL